MNTGDIFFGNAPNYGALAAKSEKKRQGIINLGLDQINAVYGGGSAPFYSMASASPFTKAQWSGGAKNNTYYTLGPSGKFKPYYAPKQAKGPSGLQRTSELLGTAVPGDITGDVLKGIRTGDWKEAGANILLNAATGGVFSFANNLFGGGDTPTPRELVNKQMRRGQLFSAPEYRTFEGFQPEFYQRREKAYRDFALPQLADQYQSANQQLVYGMSNQGLRGSSVDDKARFQLEKTMTQGKQGVADEAINQSNQLKNRVEESRQSAINQLYQTSNPSQAVQSAIANASQFQQPSSFAPLANTFANLANQYYTQQLLASYKNGGRQQPVENNLYYAPI